MTTDAVPFEQLPDVVQALGARRLKRLAREGRFPPYRRLSAYGPALWSARAVADWLTDKLAPLAPTAGSPPALAPAFDGEPDDPRVGVAP